MFMDQEYLREDGIVLNLMRGGPRHNEIYETTTLALSHGMGFITDYKWTPEIIVGSESGRSARVWVWDGDEVVE